MRILVTGGTSFTAGYLLPLLVQRFPYARITASGTKEKAVFGAQVPYIPADLGVREQVNNLFNSVNPELIFHVAGFGGRDANRCYRTNLDGTRNLMAAAACLQVQPKIIYVSSASVYGMTRAEESPVKESTPLRPVAAYGASKAAAELAALTFYHQCKIPVAVVRPFNLLGPGLPLGLAAADFLEKGKQIRDGPAERLLKVGNVSAERDFVDVRDAVRAYVDLIESEDIWGKVFNVASGIPVSIQAVLEGILTALNLDVEIRQDPGLKKQVEVFSQTGDPTALRDQTGWTPQFGLYESLRDMAQNGVS
ncbi:MAG: NAD-dependent epimerase/dehydratase family protein [Gammaproteobacteria bacterium]